MKGLATGIFWHDLSQPDRAPASPRQLQLMPSGEAVHALRLRRIDKVPVMRGAAANDHRPATVSVDDTRGAAPVKASSGATGPAFDHLFLTGMIQHHGGALTIQDALLTPDSLYWLLMDTADPEKLAAMPKALLRLAHPLAVTAMVERLLSGRIGAAENNAA